MTGLVLKLKPFEKLLINGAVLQNGPRAARLRVRTAGASVLRLRDALHPRETASAAGKIYYVAQLAVAGEADPETAKAELLSMLGAAVEPALTEQQQSAFTRARRAAEGGKLYAVMRAVKPLLAADPGEPAEPA